jgi:competence protein ComEA
MGDGPPVLSDPPASESESDISTRALHHLRKGPASTSAVSGIWSTVIRWLSRQKSSVTVRVGIGVAGVVLIALLCAVVFVRSSQSVNSPVAPQVSVGPGPSSTTTTAPGVVVDVGGAVRQPGVYRLALGSRVVDALEVAGGPAEDIDLDQMNLASTINDGQRVWFTRKGELPPAGVIGSSPDSGASVPGGPVDLNTATLEQLDSLSGIGPATAKAIIDRRNELGRFRSVDDLLTVKGIGPTKLESIRSGVVVR